MTVENSGLFAAIAKVMGSVRSLPKDGFNKQSQYKYVSSDTALDHIGKAMAEHGVIVIPSMTGYETITEGKMTRAKAEFDMHVCSADGGEFVSRWIAEGIDYGNADKALTKAITYATKTFLLKLFVVGAGDPDPDGESTPDEKPELRQTTNGKAPQATKPPVPKPKPVAAIAEPEPPIAALHPVVAEWLNADNAADAAKAWAVKHGAQPNDFAARNSLKKIVEKDFGGKFTKDNAAAVLVAFHGRQLEHLESQADAVSVENDDKVTA